MHPYRGDSSFEEQPNDLAYRLAAIGKEVVATVLLDCQPFLREYFLLIRSVVSVSALKKGQAMVIAQVQERFQLIAKNRAFCSLYALESPSFR